MWTSLICLLFDYFVQLFKFFSTITKERDAKYISPWDCCARVISSNSKIFIIIIIIIIIIIFNPLLPVINHNISHP